MNDENDKEQREEIIEDPEFDEAIDLLIDIFLDNYIRKWIA